VLCGGMRVHRLEPGDLCSSGIKQLVEGSPVGAHDTTGIIRRPLRPCPVECVTSDARLEGLEGRPPGTELLGFAARVLELGAGVSVDELASLYQLESVPFQKAGVRCFQQRPGNSAGPEVDVATPFRAHGVLDRDVRNLYSPAGSEDAEEL
jgi:hypothetical protein